MAKAQFRFSFTCRYSTRTREYTTYTKPYIYLLVQYQDQRIHNIHQTIYLPAGIVLGLENIQHTPNHIFTCWYSTRTREYTTYTKPYIYLPVQYQDQRSRLYSVKFLHYMYQRIHNIHQTQQHSYLLPLLLCIYSTSQRSRQL